MTREREGEKEKEREFDGKTAGNAKLIKRKLPAYVAQWLAVDLHAGESGVESYRFQTSSL